jgi:hypothetical protein
MTFETAPSVAMECFTGIIYQANGGYRSHWRTMSSRGSLQASPIAPS